MGQSGNNLQTAINRVCLQVFKGYTVMEFKDLFLQRNSSFFQDQKQILSGTPYALEEQSRGTL